MKNLFDNLRKIAALEQNESITAEKHSQIIIMYRIFILYYFIFGVQCAFEPDYITLITYVLLTFVFGTSALIVRLFKNHISSLMFCTIGSCCVFAYHFTITAGTINSLDAFWLWLVIFPLLCHFFAGVVYGTIVSMPFVILSIIFMWSPVSKAHSDYSSNILEFFPMIEMMSIAVSAVIQYQNSLTQLKKRELEQENQIEQIEQFKRLQEQITLYRQNNDRMAELRHDIQHYSDTLKNLLENNEIRSAVELVEQISGKQWLITPMNYCDNIIINGMLAIYAEKLKQHGSNLYVNAVVPENISMKQIDLASLIGNILENADKAVAQLPYGQGDVRIRINLAEGKLKISEENQFLTEPEFDENNIPMRNTETDRHGIGTQRIVQIAENYGGFAGFEIDETKFIVKVILHCEEISE